MKLRSFQNMSVLGFVDLQILIVFRDHQFMNGLQPSSILIVLGKKNVVKSNDTFYSECIVHRQCKYVLGNAHCYRWLISRPRLTELKSTEILSEKTHVIVQFGTKPDHFTTKSDNPVPAQVAGNAMPYVIAFFLLNIVCPWLVYLQ